MPIYEYECEKCRHRFEKIQKFSDPPVEVCPKCGGAVHKMQSAPAFQFKGTGWYVTDYAKSKPDTKETKPTPEAAKSETKSDAAKSDSSTAPAKTDTKSDS